LSQTTHTPGWEHENVCVSAVLIGGHAPSSLRLAADDFADPQARIVWELAGSLESASRPFDVPSLSEAAKNDSRGCEDALSACLDRATVHYSLAEDHARQVREHSRARRLRSVAMEIVQASRSAGADPGSFVSEWAPKLEAAIANEGSSALVSAKQACRDAVTDIAAMMRGEQTRYTLGLPRVDRALGGGIAPRRLVVVAAPTGAGKTTLAIQVARRTGRRGYPVLVISLEMSAGEVVRRSALTDAGLSEADLVNRKMTAADGGRINQALADAERDFASTTFIDRPLRPRDLVAEVRSWTRKVGGHGLVVLDYLQLVPPTDDRASRERQVAEVVAMAKNEICSSLGHACIGISQFNRGANDRAEPGLQHLRESGAIEQYAEVVLFAYPREDGPPGDEGRAPVWIKVAKNRYGESNVRAAAEFDLRRGRFVEVDLGSHTGA
jgi:replicative DNA helicase